MQIEKRGPVLALYHLYESNPEKWIHPEDIYTLFGWAEHDEMAREMYMALSLKVRTMPFSPAGIVTIEHERGAVYIPEAHPNTIIQPRKFRPAPQGVDEVRSPKWLLDIFSEFPKATITEHTQTAVARIPRLPYKIFYWVTDAMTQGFRISYEEVRHYLARDFHQPEDPVRYTNDILASLGLKFCRIEVDASRALRVVRT